ncbi:hypothetical protein pdam_00008800 [Pocillopora damicornis]|uniref:Uncharacterized protein n=1 Tax=Pocillopora damicornis TaxID=46731 RepID=A0A3M6URU9_POCDA|nr:hypothetical protein pdam_00008800 [Pocillopora damicornis]
MRRQESKLYFKTAYRNQCKEDDRKCANHSVVDQKHKCKTSIDVGPQTLTVAYQNAPTKSVKTQILSIYADRFSANELKRIHQTFENPSNRQIKKARAQAKSERPEVPTEKIHRHRIHKQQFVIPNVARTVVKCTIINQYMNHCKDVENTRSSRGHTEEIRFRGTRAVGADGFRDFL